MKPKKIFRLKKKGLNKKYLLYNSIDSDTSSFIENEPKKKLNKIIDKIRKKKLEKKSKNKFLIIPIVFIFIILLYIFYLLFSRNKFIIKDDKNDLDKFLSSYNYNENNNNNILFYYYNESDIYNIFKNYTNILNQNNVNSIIKIRINNSQTKINKEKHFNQKLY